VSISYYVEGFHYVGNDNKNLVRQMVKHMYDIHGCRKMIFAGGPKYHYENIQRFEAFCETMEELGLPVSDDIYMFGDFDFDTGVRYFSEWVDSGKEFPDAFICANDEIAMVMITTFEDYGIKVPDDVLITGFDNLPDSALFYPSVTSIDPDNRLHGRICARTMIDLLNAAPVENPIKLPSRFLSRESCGCTLAPGSALQRLRVATDAFRMQRKKDRGNWHIFYLESLMMKCESVDELRTTLSDSLSQDHFLEGDNFHILFDANAHKTLTSYDLSYEDSDSYSEQQDVIFSIRNGNIQNIHHF